MQDGSRLAKAKESKEKNTHAYPLTSSHITVAYFFDSLNFVRWMMTLIKALSISKDFMCRFMIQ